MKSQGRPGTPTRRRAVSRASARQGSTTGVRSAQARFAERARRVRMRPIRVLLVVVALAAVVAGVWWLLVGSTWFRVTGIEVAGAAPDREAVIRDAARGIEGQPLVEVDTDGLDHRVTATNLFAAVDVRRSWPDAVLVRVEERAPAVAAELDGGVFELIDREGVAYERVTQAPDGIPHVSLERPADPASRATAAAVGVALPADLRTQVEDFSVDSGARATFVVERVEVLWGDFSDSAIKAAVLRPLLDRGRVARIDLTVPTNPVTSQETSTSGSSGG